MKFSISKGHDTYQTIEVATAEELGAKACESNISTSTFKGGKRNIENFEGAEIIGLDVDNDNANGTPTISLSEARRVFSPFKHVMLATRSHGIEKNGIVADRFRIILFLERPITDANDFYTTWHWLKGQFPWIDNKCKDPSRLWYQHKEVLSIREDGALVYPIRYTEPEKPDREARAALPGERGELSKETLKFLEFGVESGSRNASTHKVARDFKQALYDYEEAEARILSALERNGVISSDFPESEAKLAVRSAYSKDAKHAPRLSELKQRAFNYVRLGDLLETPDKQEDWVVDGLLIKGGMSVIVGMPKVGKTTLVRQLERCILRGEDFLERKTSRGSVVHYSFDEKAKTAKRHYKKLGLTKEDPMTLHFGAAGSADMIKELEEDLIKLKPTIAVVDTLFDLVETEDVNSYAPIKRQLSEISSLAERSGCHIMFIHHQNKPNPNFGKGSGHSVLGSTAIFGSVDCCMIFEQVKDSNIRTLAVKGRAVDDFDRVELSFDKEKQVYEIREKTEIEDHFYR